MTTIRLKAGQTATWQDEDGRTRSLTVRINTDALTRGLTTDPKDQA